MRLCPKHKPGAYAAVMALVAVAALLLLRKPELLNAYTYSDRIYDRNGQLLHLGLSLDDKYRIRVPLQEIPLVARKALLLYEDRWFYEHPGVNPASMLRAVWQMLTGGRRQGASTLTMQVARIVYHIDSSSVSGKLLQIVRALQLEIFYSKDEILEAYFNLAPYGGNIEGIAAAAQVWFNTPVSRLNLPQILTLTVIPQNPVKRSPATPAGLKNAAAAAARLKELWREKHPVSADDDLNLPLSSGRFLPHEAPHAVRRLRETARGKIAATLDENLQKQTEAILSKYVKDNAGRGIFNAAAILVDYKTAEVLAAVGSADFFNEKIDGQVDGTAALRSPGSALKPFIYALALDQGLIHPRTSLKTYPKTTASIRRKILTVHFTVWSMPRRRWFTAVIFRRWICCSVWKKTVFTKCWKKPASKS